MQNIDSVTKKFKINHPDLYQFIVFNIMSNVATITNFIVLWVGTGFIFNKINGTFHWWIFDYKSNQGGLGGFLSFLLAYICAQIVNFIVQRKIVFGSKVKINKVIYIYILTVVVVGIISVWLPPYIINQLHPIIGVWAVTAANVVNIIVQVVINYPMMKFVIMK